MNVLIMNYTHDHHRNCYWILFIHFYMNEVQSSSMILETAVDLVAVPELLVIWCTPHQQTDFLNQSQKYIFSVWPAVLFIQLDTFGVSCRVLEISAERCLPSLQYNENRRHWACLAQNAKKKKIYIHLKNSKAMFLSRNHDPVTFTDLVGPCCIFM